MKYRVSYFENPIAGFNRTTGSLFGDLEMAHAAVAILHAFNHPDVAINIKNIKDDAPLYNLRIYDWHNVDHIFDCVTKYEVCRQVLSRVRRWRKENGFDPDAAGMRENLRKFFEVDDTGVSWEEMFPESVENQFSLRRINPTRSHEQKSPSSE